jgi:hypothetical protein
MSGRHPFSRLDPVTIITHILIWEHYPGHLRWDLSGPQQRRVSTSVRNVYTVSFTQMEKERNMISAQSKDKKETFQYVALCLQFHKHRSTPREMTSLEPNPSNYQRKLCEKRFRTKETEEQRIILATSALRFRKTSCCSIPTSPLLRRAATPPYPLLTSTHYL